MEKKLSENLIKEVEETTKRLKETRSKLTKYITDIIDEFGNIEFDTEYDDEYVNICVDGFDQTLVGVNKLYDFYNVDSEFGSINLYYLTFDDLVNVAYAVQSHFEKKDEKKEEE